MTCPVSRPSSPVFSRRRFLTISAMALAVPARAEPIRWHGYAMGAVASMTLDTPPDLAQAAITAVTEEIATGQALFSLYDPHSALSRLNKTGVLHDPHPSFQQVLHLSDRVHRLTNGAFDPTIQPLWQALATQGDIAKARALIGWDRVAVSPRQVRLDTGQQLSLNGIAQGFVTQQVATRLKALGLRRVLVNIGEFAGLGGPWKLGIADPAWGLVATRTLTDCAIATSSPQATLLRGHSHILGAKASPRWSTVSVEAPDAALADAASTGFTLMRRREIRAALRRFPEPLCVHLVGEDGRVHHL